MPSGSIMLNSTRPTVVSISAPGLASSSSVFSRRRGRQLDLDAGVRVDRAQRVGQLHFVERGEDHALALAAGQRHRHVVATHHHVLRRADDRRAVGRAEDVVGRHHQRVGFDLGLDRQRQVDGHLVAVEVGVEALADQRMQA